MCFVTKRIKQLNAKISWTEWFTPYTFICLTLIGFIIGFLIGLPVGCQKAYHMDNLQSRPLQPAVWTRAGFLLQLSFQPNANDGNYRGNYRRYYYFYRLGFIPSSKKRPEIGRFSIIKYLLKSKLEIDDWKLEIGSSILLAVRNHLAYSV